jgi:cell division protein FtsI/penicillin-binding protein 2
MIRDWNMNELVPYLERFGIGQYTGVDLPGEMSGSFLLLRIKESLHKQ